jgi:PleD family two-component response regulator
MFIARTGATTFTESFDGVRVILVDDDKERMSLLEAALSAAGHDVAGRLPGLASRFTRAVSPMPTA